MKNSNTSERLKSIMDEKRMRQVDILRAAEPFCTQYGVKLGKSALSQYISGQDEPGQEKLSILGMALNVSEVWLMGYDVSRERSITPIAGEGDRRIGEYVDLFNLLSDTQQSLVIHAIKGLLSEKQ